MSEEKFDNDSLRDEIFSYLALNAKLPHTLVTYMTDDIVDIFVKRLTEFNRRPIYPVKTVISPESRIHRYYCPVCGKQQKSKADGDTWYCERCGEKLRMVRDSG